jgi:hypothetical protein
MMMNKLLLLIVPLLLLPGFLFPQNGKIKYSRNCSELLEQVSAQWKEDSLGINKFRSQVAYRLAKCKIDNVSASYLLEKLGQPNGVYTNPGSIAYTYYIFSGKHPSGWLYTESLVFEFDEKTLLLLKIGTADNDRT